MARILCLYAAQQGAGAASSAGGWENARTPVHTNAACRFIFAAGKFLFF